MSAVCFIAPLIPEGRTRLSCEHKPRPRALIAPETLAELISAGARLLVVGPSYHTDRFLQTWHMKPQAQRSFHTLAPQLLLEHRPDVVLSPLLAQDFDILDVVDRLVRIGFGGRLVAVTGSLPDAVAVQNEVRQQCAQFRFDLVELSPDESIRS